MARQKEFNRDEVLHKAMEVFWTRGYEGSSIQDLVKHMGINRQSIYDTFGDKHGLFLQALDRYREIQSRKVFAVLERPGSMKKNLRQLFEEAVARSLSAEGRRGCFVGNSMSELAGAAKRQPLEPVTAWPRRRKCSRRPCKEEKSKGNCGGLATLARWRAFSIAIFRDCS